MRIPLWMKLGASGGAYPRTGEPITFGVPFPSGAVHDHAVWRLTGPTGQSSAVQTRVLDRWRDGSVRWILVDARVDRTSTADTRYFLEPGEAAPVHASIILNEQSHELTVDTGRTKFRIKPGSAILFHHTDGTECALRLVDRYGVARDALVSDARVDEPGPLRSAVRLKGEIAGSGERDRLVFTVYLHFFAGLTVVRALVTLTNPNRAIHKGGFWDLGDPGSILIKDASLDLKRLSPSDVVRLSLGQQAAWETLSAPVEIYQDSSGGEQWQSSNHINRERRIPLQFRGYRVKAAGLDKNGLRATPIVQAGEVSASVPHFWQNFPKAIEARRDSLIVRLFPGQFSDLHEIQGGEQKTHECFVAFGDDPVTAEPLEWTRARTVACVDPAFVFTSGAVPFLAPLTPEHGALVNSAVDGPESFEAKREIIDEYGWRHFGELYGDHESVRQKKPPLVSHYNNQYDTVAGFTWQFLRTADVRWRRLAHELADHVVDVDIYHTNADKSAYNGGMFWHTYHYGDADTATHRTYPSSAKGRTHGGGPSADHNYTTGLMLEYFLTGDARYKEAVVGLAQYVIDLDDGRQTVLRWLDRGSTGRATLSAGYYGPGRGPANSLNALIDGFRLSANRLFLDKAEEILRRVVHPDEDVRRHNLDDPEARWFYTMFLQSLGKYLALKADRAEIDSSYVYGQASLLAYARWMSEHEYPYLTKAEKLEFPTETWAAQEIRKSDVFFYAACHSSGEDRNRFMQRGEFFHKYSTSTLQTAQTRALARPVVVLLVSGFLYGWYRGNPAFRFPEGERPPSFGPVIPFVPQKTRAKRRLLVVGAGAAVSISAGVLWMFL